MNSDHSLITVSMVPSAGLATASYIYGMDFLILDANWGMVRLLRSPASLLKPNRNWAKIIPELPRAFIMVVSAIRLAVTVNDLSGRIDSIADRMVMAMLLPVSPSLTG